MYTPLKQIKYCTCLDRSIPLVRLPYRWVTSTRDFPTDYVCIVSGTIDLQ